MGEDQVSEETSILSARIVDILMQIVHKATLIDSQPVDLGDGYLLSAADIHLIDMTGRFPGDNISELAIRLGVTKGAVSQMVQKLEIRGYLNRKKGEGNRKNVCLQLTRRGKTAFDWHRSLHTCVDEQILSGLKSLNPRDLHLIVEIFTRLGSNLDRSLEIRDAHLKEFIEHYHPEEPF